VVSARRDNKRIPIPGNLPVTAIQNKRCLTLFNPEELVDMLVHLVADFLAGLHFHQHQLKVFARVENLPEIVIIFG